MVKDMFKNFIKFLCFLYTLNAYAATTNTPATPPPTTAKQSPLYSKDVAKVLALVAKSLVVTGQSMVNPNNPSISSTECNPNSGYEATNRTKSERVTFCSLTKFARQDQVYIANGFFCELAKVATTFDKSTRVINITTSSAKYDKNCWPYIPPEDGIIPLKVTGITPSNSKYEKGVTLEATDLRIELGLSLNDLKSVYYRISGSPKDPSATGFTADLNFQTGDMHYEFRDNYLISENQNLLPSYPYKGVSFYSYHNVLYSKLKLNTFKEPTSAQSFSYAFSQISKGSDEIAKGSFVTTAGDPVKGFRSRIWNTTQSPPLSLADIQNKSKWVELPSNCQTLDSNITTCGAGLGGFTLTPIKFILASSNTASIVKWLSSFNLPSFTSINVNSDVQ